MNAVDTGFNPRVREGRDLRLYSRLTALLSFNPRVREGRDQRRIRTDCFPVLFQSTRP